MTEEKTSKTESADETVVHDTESPAEPIDATADPGSAEAGGPDADGTSSTDANAQQGTVDGEGITADLTRHLERIWDEVKKISRQVEQETRRSSRIARIRIEIRRLHKEISEAMSEIGQLVYDAQKAGSKRPTLSRVEGYDALVETVDNLRQRISEKEAEIEVLKEEGVEPLGGDQNDAAD